MREMANDHRFNVEAVNLFAYAMFILLRPYLWESTTFPLFSSSSKGPN